MLTIHRASPVLGIVLAAALSGCAAGYRAYQGPCIPYAYCPPPPLPYTLYTPCGCPTPIAARYGQRLVPAAKKAANGHYVPSVTPAAGAAPGAAEAPLPKLPEVGP
jgi:hypothetical protein